MVTNTLLGKIAATVGIIALLMSGWAFVKTWSELDTKVVGEYMAKAAEEMGDIKSQSGTSINEAYFQADGRYKRAEAKAQNAELWHARYEATTQFSIALLLSTIVILYGIGLMGGKNKLV